APSIDSERRVTPDARGRLRGDARAESQAAVQGRAETADQNIAAEAAAAVDRAGDENDRWPPPCDVDGASRSDAHARSPATVVRVPDQHRRRPGSTIIVAVTEHQPETNREHSRPRQVQPPVCRSTVSIGLSSKSVPAGGATGRPGTDQAPFGELLDVRKRRSPANGSPRPPPGRGDARYPMHRRPSGPIALRRASAPP